jgi:hypothetical protein
VPVTSGDSNGPGMGEEHDVPKTLPSIPDFLSHRPVDHRGYPYLFMLGEEQFKGLLMDRVYRCATERLCGICGEKMGYWVTFVGGPMSCANRTFSDPPFHPECAEFAFDICPYLLMGGWDRSKARHMEGLDKADPMGFNIKPDKMGIYTTRQFRWETLRSGFILFNPAPAKRIEWREATHVPTRISGTS